MWRDNEGQAYILDVRDTACNDDHAAAHALQAVSGARYCRSEDGLTSAPIIIITRRPTRSTRSTPMGD